MVRLRSQLAALCVLGLVAAGCGARLDDRQLQAARQGGGAAGGVLAPGDTIGVDGEPALGGDPALGGLPGGEVAAEGDGPIAGGDATAPGGSGRPSAAPGGNGGATDIGVTPTEITLGNVSTLSGPVPGLFQGAVLGTQAFLAYQNSLGGVHGRRLKLSVRDDQFEASENRKQTEELTKSAFAMVGSFSIFDDASAEVMRNNAGMPDVVHSLSTVRFNNPNNFSPAPQAPGWRLGPLQWYKSKFPNAVTKVGTIIGQIASAKQQWDYQRAAMESLGYQIIYSRDYQPLETDFTTDVIRMRSAGVQMVVITAADVNTLARFAQEMSDQDWQPEVFATGGIGYDPKLIPLAGASAEGMFNDQGFSMFMGEDADRIPEVRLFNEWLNKIKPGYKPDLFAANSWAATRMFVEALEAAGPRATRAAVMAELRKVTSFNANGMIATSNPAQKKPSTCWVLVRVQGGKFVRWDMPDVFRCDGGYFSVKQ